MDITKRFKNALAVFRKNSITPAAVDGDAFRRFGPRRTMPSVWSAPEITDQDFYTGYGFAVINKRANRSVVLGKKFLFTDAKEEIVKEANQKKSEVVHPYLDLIRNSLDFAERDFWYNISTYLDLEGVYYLMAVRTVSRGGASVGNIQKFVLLNPYNVHPVVDPKGNLGGYVENYNNLQREIPKEMIIPIRLLNPFDQGRAYSLADAARDSQFTLKQANDFAREAIDGNLNAPGILSSAIELPDDQFDNFVDRVKNHGRGEPLFGNGAGTVHWENMQTDLDKAALDKINSINRDTLLAISGLSKTGVGVEESGTGREVSRTQKDDFTENAVMPQIENIIDALNLDYRRYYPTTYAKNGYTIILDNPLETNRDAEQADVDIRDSQFTLLQSLLDAGYEYDIAAKYAAGLVDVTAIGAPPKPDPATQPPAPANPADPNNPTPPPADPANPPTPPANPPAKKPRPAKASYVYEGYPVPVVQYLEELGDQINALSEKASFIYSTEEDPQTVRINHIEEKGNSLLAIVDENTYIKLGEFNNTADRIAILTKLNKRYKNQPVAIKGKIDLDHKCNHDVYEVIKNTAFDKNTHIEANTKDLLSSATAAESRLFEWYADQIARGVSNPHPTDLEPFINSLTMPFAVYFTTMFPIYATNRLHQTSKQLGIDDPIPVVALTQEVKNSISEFARKEATSHINTIRTDIENALAKIRVETSDPAEQRAKFELAFAAIQESRSLVIANNAAARIFNLSQYEADLQLLTRAGLVDDAYKELFSLTGDPCPICQYIISATKNKPISFTSAFANMGDTIESEGTKMTFNYEEITAGNVHPNCHCAYRLIMKNEL